jgi:hypothetical protein
MAHSWMLVVVILTDGAGNRFVSGAGPTGVQSDRIMIYVLTARLEHEEGGRTRADKDRQMKPAPEREPPTELVRKFARQ